MPKIEQIAANQILSGVEPGKAVRVISVERPGERSVNLYYKDGKGRLAMLKSFIIGKIFLPLNRMGECPV